MYHTTPSIDVYTTKTINRKQIAPQLSSTSNGMSIRSGITLITEYPP